MIQKAFLMQVQPGKTDEYIKRHNPIWKELHDVLKAHGIHTITIFLHAETNMLFSYMEIEDEEKLKKLANNEVCQRWWKDMKNYLVSKSGNTLKAKEEELREICRIE